MSQNIPFKLLEWINFEQLDSKFLNYNPNAIHILEQDTSKINLYILCDNPSLNAIYILEKYLDTFDDIYWYDIFANPNAINIIEKNIDKLFTNNAFWTPLSSNYNAMHILKKYPDKICIKGLCSNTHPQAIKILEKNYDKINWNILCKNPNAIHLIERKLTEPYIPEIDFLDFRDERPYKNINWDTLCMNPNAVHILERNLDKINYDYLCYNENAKAIDLLEQNQDKINWYILSANPSAIYLLEANKDKVNYKHLSKNPAIFIYDYETMRQNHKELKEELIMKRWNPERIFDLLEKGIDLEDL